MVVLPILHLVSRNPPKKKPGKTANHQQKIKKLEKTAEELNKQLQDRKNSFNLEEADCHIRNLKKERNSSSHEGQRNVMAAEIKIMKQRRWTDFKHIEILRREIKEARRKAYFFRITTLADNVQDVSQNHEASDDFIDSLLTNINDLKLSRTDYDLQTISVTVGVSLKMFNAHLNLYNEFNPEHPLPIKHQLDTPFLVLPKAHKLTSKSINYLLKKPNVI
ncbi:hypothetical protein BDF21DRAFT_406872 [Thamnidium elegans]|nr:hypothetical protein BDF21DRAFT_406872 [Thamnidium elegans]